MSQLPTIQSTLFVPFLFPKLAGAVLAALLNDADEFEHLLNGKLASPPNCWD